MKENRNQRVVEVDPSVRSLEEYVDSLFKARSENIEDLMGDRRLNTHWFDLRLGDWRLKLLPAGHQLLTWDGLGARILWDNHKNKWEIAGFLKVFGDRKVVIKRANGDMTITVQPKKENEFWMGDIIYHFGNGIVKLDEALQPLGREKVEPYQLGGMIRIEIDEDSLAFISMHADELDMDPFYCLYMKKNQPLAKGLCDPMRQLLGQYFGA